MLMGEASTHGHRVHITPHQVNYATFHSTWSGLPLKGKVDVLPEETWYKGCYAISSIHICSGGPDDDPGIEMLMHACACKGRKDGQLQLIDVQDLPAGISQLKRQACIASMECTGAVLAGFYFQFSKESRLQAQAQSTMSIKLHLALSSSSRDAGYAWEQFTPDVAP